MNSILQDLRFALRTLRTNRGFTAAAIVMLALGIGANTAIFSVVHALLLRRLPFPQSDRVAFVWASQKQMDLARTATSDPDYLDWKRAASFESMGILSPREYTLTGRGSPERIASAQFTASVFDVLRVTPVRGRVFRADEETSAVVVIGQRLWARRFGSDPNLLGKSIALDGKPHTVIGIMPPWFDFIDGQQLWTPYHAVGEASTRGAHSFLAVGRLAPGVSLAQAQTEMTGIAQRLAREYKDTNEGWEVEIQPVQEAFVENTRRLLLALTAAVAFVLLIVCANVANLLLARATGRRREVAIRSALGATRLRVIRQLLTESLLLAIAGGVLGATLAAWGVSALRDQDAGMQNSFIQVDSTTLLFTLGLSVITGVLFGLAPAFTTSHLTLTDALKTGGRGSTAGNRFLKNAFVVAEIALALVLLAGAGLMMRSFVRLRSVTPGFDSGNLLTARISLPPAAYPTKIQAANLMRSLTDRLAALPGVRNAAITTTLPMHGADEGGEGVWLIGHGPISHKDVPIIYHRWVTPEYFKTLGLQLLRGRGIAESDADKAAPVVVLNQSAARRLFPSEDPIGKLIGFDRTTKAADGVTVVGVVSDSLDTGLNQPPRMAMYLPYRQAAAPGRLNQFSVVIRTERDPTRITSGLRAALADLDATVPLSHIETMQETISQTTSEGRNGMWMFSLFGAVALLLATFGIYGVMAYTVAQRTNEIGVRMALGAQQRDISKMVLGDSAKVVAIGVAIGIAGSLLLTRFLEGQLFGVKTYDPLTFIAVTILLGGVAALASYVPARRAARVDPTVALRYE